MIKQQFKIYPDCHWLYFDVIIHHDRRAMLRVVQDAGSDFDGICRSWVSVFDKKLEDGNHYISNPKVGEIHLFSRRTGVGVTSHEVCHAVHHYFWIRKRCNSGPVLKSYRRGLRDSSHKEESFCWIMGELYRQFCVNFWSKKQIKPPKQKIVFPVKKGTRIKPTQKSFKQG